MCSMNLESTRPEIAIEWHPTKNILAPSEVPAGSSKKAWWICPRDSTHDYIAKISHRTNMGSGCPYCAGRMVNNSNCLSTLRPDLAIEWHPRNTLLPSSVPIGSHKSVWWICSKGHEWEAIVYSRKKTGCPYCSGRLPTISNNLATQNPSLAREWHTRNPDPPENSTANSHKKVWWRCSKNSDHEWMATITNRNHHGRGCPFCSGRLPTKTNNLTTLHPDIAKQWGSKNGFGPETVTSGSTQKVWWECDRGHEWQNSVNNRTNPANRNSCPICLLSKGEEAIRKHLEKLELPFMREFRFANCKGTKPLPFDFVVFPAGMDPGVIEFQGKQHYQSVEYYGGEQAFLKRQFLDKIKRDFLADRRLSYLEITHTDINIVPQLIDGFLLSLPKRRQLAI